MKEGEVVKITIRTGRLVDVTRAYFVIITLSALIFAMACQGREVVGGEIKVRNDILDKAYNSFVVDQIVNDRGAVPYGKILKPGEQVILPFKRISQLRFIRRYEDHSKVYLVSCPKDFNEAIEMKLIDVHTNRLGGGCELIKRGVMSKGGLVKWE